MADVLALELVHCRPRVLRALQRQLMEREIIYYLLWDLTTSEPGRQTIAPEPALAKNPSPLPILIPSVLVTVNSHFSTLSDPPLSYTTYPEEGRVASSHSDWSSYSSCESSPPSPGPKTPPDEDSCAASTLGGEPIHIDFINLRSDIIMMHNVHKCTWRFGSWCRLVMFK